MAEGRKASARKTTAKKRTAGKTAAKKSTAGKTASKSTKKTAAKSSARKVAPRQSPSERKVVSKKVETKKAAPTTRTPADTGRLRITQVRSPIGRPEKQKATLRALGLRKISQSVEHKDTPVIRGMVNRVIHLVMVEELPA